MKQNPAIFFRFLYTEAKAVLHTDSFLIKEDPSLHTFYNFIKGGDYLNSNWTDQLHQNRRLHVIYLAVNPQMQHHGIAAGLLEETIRYADQHRMMISLETHNQNNVSFIRNLDLRYMVCLKKFLPETVTA